jgi:xanthine dehydrogenase accessory factor
VAAIEDDLIDRTRRLGMTQQTAEAVTYGVSADEARRFGLPCGGTIQLVVEPLSKASGMRAPPARDRGRPSRRAAAGPRDR